MKISDDNYASLSIKVEEMCGVTMYDQKDSKLFHKLLEISWGGIELPYNDLVYGEPLTSAIARLGMYHVYDYINLTYRVMVPPFLLNYIGRNSISIISMSLCEDKGTRLESIARRIFFLRCLIDKSPDNWTSVG